MPSATSSNSRSGKDEDERWPARLVGGRLREVRRGRGLTLDDVEGTYFGGEGVVNYVLSPRGERRAQVIETHIAPGGSPGPEPWSHNGELVSATVLEGRVEFRFGEHSTTLQAGDTVSYSPAEPHSWHNPDGENPAVALFFEVPAEY
jgi:quercetin dioxygenase-like cupin family protein